MHQESGCTQLLASAQAVQQTDTTTLTPSLSLSLSHSLPVDIFRFHGLKLTSSQCFYTQGQQTCCR